MDGKSSVYFTASSGPSQLKYRNLLCGDLDGCARLGVSALAGLSLAHPKGTKSHKRYRIPFFECFLDCRKCCAYGQRRFLLAAGTFATSSINCALFI